jgi:hypothetical protein
VDQTQEGMSTNRYYKKDKVKMARNIKRGEMQLEADFSLDPQINTAED